MHAVFLWKTQQFRISNPPHIQNEQKLVVRQRDFLKAVGRSPGQGQWPTGGLRRK